MKTRVALLWHMHQPMYVDPVSGEAILPWVRFHATHAYYDMGRMLERHPDVRATVNFVPSLVEQIESAVNGTCRERYLEASRKNPEEMTREERLFVVRQFFMADRERCILPVPRYRELLQRRGEKAGQIDVNAFSIQDIRDIQVHFNLAWMGFSARAEEPDVQALLAKGGGFTEEEKAALLDTQQRILGAVLPLWRRLASAGRVEISSTPYFHPILPLLCDSDSARRAMPDATLPPRFSYPQDAHEQVRLAIERHTEVFGVRPTGMWPAEGSVSPEAVDVFVAEGIRWIATDEGILFRSTPAPTDRGQLYQAWSCDSGPRPIAMIFRDHQLSDRVGFTYARMSGPDAVTDFLAQVRQAEMQARRIGIPDPIIPVVLDGENAWEHYEGKGELFLNALYEALEKAPDLSTATLADALAQPTAHLTRIHSGSWIDSNYRIWIGHPEDNLAWTLLGQVRALFSEHERAGDIPADRLAQVRRLLLSAEGSDWFWWYGGEFETENAAEFDALFRNRLLQAATLLNEIPPARLNEPISDRARQQKARRALAEPQTALIHPPVDGHDESFLRWIGAGSFRPDGAQGAMYRTTTLISRIRFGSDLENLYLRLDPTASLDGALLTLTLANVSGSSRAIPVPLRKGALAIPLPGARGASDEVIELALPLRELALRPGDTAQLEVSVSRDGAELERVPAQGPFSFRIADADIESAVWRV
jgi:alpha-amylase/alpha-mannosidase (GH57 family)